MAVHVLGQGVADQIGAQLQGPLEVGGQEGVVDGQDQILADSMDELGNGLNVGHLDQRIRGRLDPHQLGLRLDGGLNKVQIRGVHEGGGDSQAGGYLTDQAVGSSVYIVAHDDVIAAAQHGQHGGGGSQSRREGQTELGVVQGGEARFQDSPGGISATGVLVAPVLARSILLEGGTQRYLRNHGGTLPLLGALARVDGLGGEAARLDSVAHLAWERGPWGTDTWRESVATIYTPAICYRRASASKS